MQEECENLVEVAEGPSLCLDEEHKSERHAAAVQEAAVYGIKVWVRRDYDDVLAATKRSLDKEGFTALTEIDIRDFFCEKLNRTFPRYTILGACDPELAHQALKLDLDIGLLFPCNVIVYEQGGGTVVEAIDTIAHLAIAGNSELHDIARAMKVRLQDAVDHIASGVA